jgi:hypothetical protein
MTTVSFAKTAAMLRERVARGDTCGLRTPTTDFRPCTNTLDGGAIALVDGTNVMVMCGYCLPDCFTSDDFTTTAVLLQHDCPRAFRPDHERCGRCRTAAIVNTYEETAVMQ